jgi:diguanylate cyclase (GGDEF)-like protein
MVGRYGGEEFFAILPNTGVEEACDLAEKIRLACHRYTVYTTEENQAVNFTTSIGVALRKGHESAEELLRRVDKGLYKAKSSGRDLVSVAD